MAEKTGETVVTLCASVQVDAIRIAGLILAGRYDDAGQAATMLAGRVGTIKQQHLMRQEQSGEYDLAALRVDVTSASNSETGFEEE